MGVFLDNDTCFMILTMGTNRLLPAVANQAIKHKRVRPLNLQPLDKWYHTGLACQFLNVFAIPPDLEKLVFTHPLPLITRRRSGFCAPPCNKTKNYFQDNTSAERRKSRMDRELPRQFASGRRTRHPKRPPDRNQRTGTGRPVHRHDGQVKPKLA